MKGELLLTVLGKSVNAPGWNELLSELAQEPQIDEYKYCRYFCFKTKGLSFVYDSQANSFTSIFIYSPGFEGYSGYTNEVPGGFTFLSSKSEIRTLLGEPSCSGKIPGEDNVMMDWELFAFGSYTIHCQFLGEQLLLVTIALGDAG